MSLKEMCEAKLKSSGLTTKHAAALGMVGLSREQTAKLGKKSGASFEELASLQLNYFHPATGKPTGFFRLRYLEEPEGFDAMAAKKKTRYVQPRGTLPEAYFPRGVVDWKKLLDDAELPLIITEGELKAAKACVEGFPTIGLGGVQSWRSIRQGIDWLPTLEPIRFERRRVVLCFDSDMSSNSNVRQALRDLAQQLIRRGAHVHIAALPPVKGLDKVGLDDFLTYGGASAPEELRQILDVAAPFGLTEVLWKMNDDYAVIISPGLVVKTNTLEKMSAPVFKDLVASKDEYYEGRLLENGQMAYEPVNAAGAWLRWPLRNQYARLTYAPGSEALTAEGALNVWRGWGVKPIRGDVSPFLKLVDHLFGGAEEEAKRWFLRWCAYPLKYPGTKLFSSVVIHGVRHGTGKSFLGLTLGRIYGKNFTEISQMDLHNHFNEWAEGKQLVLGDDVTGPDKRSDADFLKKLVTQREIRINGKYVPTYTMPDCVNYFFTANHPDAFFLEDDDRRFFIHEVTVGPLPEGFYRDYELWLDTDGAPAVFDYLLKLDLGDFNPAGAALRTHAKSRMTAVVRSDLASWVRGLRESPDQLLRAGEIVFKQDLFTSTELLLLYDREQRTKTTANGIGRELSRAGFRQVRNGAPISANGMRDRFYAVRNENKWLNATQDEIVSHLEAKEKPPKERRARY